MQVPIPGPLQEARFLERPNRFLVHCRLEATGEVVRAHLADPGRLRELLVPGCRIWVRPEHVPTPEPGVRSPASTSAGLARSVDSAAPTPGPRAASRALRPPRTTAWTALLVAAPHGRGLISLHTTLPNRLVRQALLVGGLEELKGWTLERAEVPLGRSRIDFLLGRGQERLALEVKSVTLVEDGVALFPDAVTARGARHVRELAEVAQRPGWAAAILFVVQREDAACVRAAASIDPVFATALAAARLAGVRVLARRCRVSLAALELAEPVGCE